MTVGGMVKSLEKMSKGNMDMVVFMKMENGLGDTCTVDPHVDLNIIMMSDNPPIATLMICSEHGWEGV